MSHTPFAVHPPSAKTVVPVTYEAPSESKKLAVEAISLASPTLPTGTLLSNQATWSDRLKFLEDWYPKQDYWPKGFGVWKKGIHSILVDWTGRR